MFSLRFGYTQNISQFLMFGVINLRQVSLIFDFVIFKIHYPPICKFSPLIDRERVCVGVCAL